MAERAASPTRAQAPVATTDLPSSPRAGDTPKKEKKKDAQEKKEKKLMSPRALSHSKDSEEGSKEKVRFHFSAHPPGHMCSLVAR